MSKQHRQPNILLICADQHRWDYLGCAGAAWLNTPHLDRLAETGVRFPVCISNSPICVPARVGLATGRQPACIGAVDNQYYLDPRLPTYYQRLRDAGYRVGCAGKLDLAKPDEYNGRDGKRPRTFQWGFTDPVEIEGKAHSLGHPTPVGPYGFWLQEQGLYETYYQERLARSGELQWFEPSDLPAKTFLDVYQADRAVQWLEDLPVDSPWHLFVSFSGPHGPFDPPRQYVERYRNAAIPEPLPTPADTRGRSFWNQPGDPPTDPTKIRSAREAYSGYVELIDEQIGRILDALRHRPDHEQTYIFFTSDHGEMLGDLGLWAKSRPYEASLRVPLIATGPGIPSGQTSDALIEWIDLNPTICGLAGLPPQPGIEALSFAACLFDTTCAHRPETVSAMRSWWCLRTERYKLVDQWNDVSKLYDLQDDPGEQHNIFKAMQQEQPDLVVDLHRRLNARFTPNPYANHCT